MTLLLKFLLKKLRDLKLNTKEPNSFDRKEEVKSDFFDFERINSFWKKNQTNEHQRISEDTAKDLDFEELYMFLDRTISSVGQQYLYYVLRTIPRNNYRAAKFESIIETLNSNHDKEALMVKELKKLRNNGAYFIQNLIFEKGLTRPNWFWLIKPLSLLTLTGFISLLFYPVIAPFLLVPLLINFGIHFWNKKNLILYSNSMPQLQTLQRITNKLIQSEIINDSNNEIRKANDKIKKLSKLSMIYNLESQVDNEIGQALEYLLSLIRAAFLIEPIIIFKIINELSHIKYEILKIFIAVAEIDVAQSINSLRSSLHHYCKPIILETGNEFILEGLYHPLIIKPVNNNIDLSSNKSALIFGSNMAGKTTFIRTVGINCLLSQTINTALAEKIIMPRVKIFTSIRIQDDLINEASYYFQEVNQVRLMLEESENEDLNIFLMDELFKGTNTVERIGASKAVLSHLSKNGNIVLVASHDLELSDLLKNTNKFNQFHFSEVIDNGELSFDYKLKNGRLVNTNAIRILELNRFPQSVIKEAIEITKLVRKEK